MIRAPGLPRASRPQACILFPHATGTNQPSPATQSDLVVPPPDLRLGLTVLALGGGVTFVAENPYVGVPIGLLGLLLTIQTNRVQFQARPASFPLSPCLSVNAAALYSSAPACPALLLSVWARRTGGPGERRGGSVAQLVRRRQEPLDVQILRELGGALSRARAAG